ncbi:MAG: bifunctional 4-hydroxy-3-methylbut-2-enyl diphosphate reductase/30S ribosomal protein S1 [Clostridia bacterium]|nr:bifunctional 4-hydroxy-3-methylbut-2-enyl diphosphate reductase/30S ribosomal protein S1 [Clostridia bacterium]
MTIIVAKYGGFCFGVKRAVSTVIGLAEENGAGAVFTWGPIIHNEQVLSDLENRGVTAIGNAAGIKPGDTVVIRSHGVGPDVIDELNATGCRVVDATCPYVKKIHQIVRNAVSNGKKVIIVGKKEHPEVIGIKGWSQNTAIVIGSVEEARNLGELENVCVVAQTTTVLEDWEQILSEVRKHVSDAEVHCSICSTTSNRQREAKEIAQKSDVVIVIGGRASANTKHLFDVSSAECSRCYKIETKDDLQKQWFEGANVIGVIAGASTPECIIEEVITSMSEVEKNTATEEIVSSEEAVVEAAEEKVAEVAAETVEETVVVEEAIEETTEESVAAAPSADEAQEADETSEESSFAQELEAFEKKSTRIRNHQIIKGEVLYVNDEEVVVNIGGKSEGFIQKSDFSSDPNVNLREAVKEGDEIEVEVIKKDSEGNYILSKKNVDSKKNWRNVIEANENGEVIKVTVKEAVKGGLVADAFGIRAFIPASHVAMRYVDNMEKFVGQEMDVKIIELDKAKHRVVASRKEVLVEEAEAAKKRVWENLEVGMRIKGTVQRLTNFGAFVDIGGVDGLIHINDLSWGRIKHPSDVVKPGDEVEVEVLALDQEKERISLGYKQTKAHPWDGAVEKYPSGAVVKGKVVRIVPFGAFVELESGLDGLVHISNIANRRLEKVEDALKVGDEVDVKILEVNPENKRISLSIKATLPREEGDDSTEEERPRRERREKREPREHRSDRQPRERRERRDRNSGETTSYSEDSGITIGDLIPDELKSLFGESKDE